MRDKIMKKIEEQDWKFSDLLKLKDVANSLAEELYMEMSNAEKIKLVWEHDISNGTFAMVFPPLVKEHLTKEIMLAFQNKFESATVSFGEVKPPPQEIPPPPPEPIEEPIKESKPPKKGEVKTRGGNVKVKRV
tara:strand:- start:2460 stop:2858 length:399 start_codon:yes stop_codon:yes gene_type:complete